MLEGLCGVQKSEIVRLRQGGGDLPGGKLRPLLPTNRKT
jgi:hypothetical protein